MYPEQLVAPMRAELVDAGVKELKTADEVTEVLNQQAGTVLLIVNSVCGCAAGTARPGARLALKHSKQPDKVVTVFAGMEKEVHILLSPLFDCIFFMKNFEAPHFYTIDLFRKFFIISSKSQNRTK